MTFRNNLSNHIKDIKADSESESEEETLNKILSEKAKQDNEKTKKINFDI